MGENNGNTFYENKLFILSTQYKNIYMRLLSCYKKYVTIYFLIYNNKQHKRNTVPKQLHPNVLNRIHYHYTFMFNKSAMYGGIISSFVIMLYTTHCINVQRQLLWGGYLIFITWYNLNRTSKQCNAFENSYLIASSTIIKKDFGFSCVPCTSMYG